MYHNPNKIDQKNLRADILYTLAMMAVVYECGSKSECHLKKGMREFEKKGT